mmetsp:Transcript_15071/g.41430  ORF Transcript_15071/g.41430 Transcript_15071/m.41430 type:complete len:285 (+) Transcript_15071:608-1462(+)
MSRPEPVFERYGGSASALRSEGSTRQGRFSVCAGLHSVCGLRLAHSNLSYEATCQVTETDSSTLVVKSGSSIFIAARTAASLRPKVTHAFQHRRMVFDLLPHGMQGTIHQVHVLVELFEPLLQLTKAPVGGTDPGLEFRMLRFPHQPEPLGHLFLRPEVRRPEQRRMLQEIVGRHLFQVPLLSLQLVYLLPEARTTRQTHDRCVPAVRPRSLPATVRTNRRSHRPTTVAAGNRGRVHCSVNFVHLVSERRTARQAQSAVHREPSFADQKALDTPTHPTPVGSPL